MGDWSYLSSLLDQVQAHSTVVGKVWLSVLLLFRLLVLGAAAEQVWADELSQFYCDSLEPGCQQACYTWRFPVSLVHYWQLQVLLVSTPTLAYLGHAVHLLHRDRRRPAAPPRYGDGRGKVRIRGVLLCSYLARLLATILLEAGFCVGQFFVFGSVPVDAFFHCPVPPCAALSGAQCSVSRPTEKSVFVVFMLAVSGVSVLLNVAEMVYLLCRRRKNRRRRNLAARQQNPLSVPLEELRPHAAMLMRRKSN